MTESISFISDIYDLMIPHHWCMQGARHREFFPGRQARIKMKDVACADLFISRESRLYIQDYFQYFASKISILKVKLNLSGTKS